MMIRANYLAVVCILSVAASPLPSTVSGESNLGDALMKANTQGFPSELLYDVAGLMGRSNYDKAQLAAALESPKVQQAARKAALEYAVKDLPTSRENTEGYCSYSWLRWLPLMNCDEPLTEESRQTFQLINTKKNCAAKRN